MKRKKVKSKHSYMYSPGMIQCAVDIATGDDGSCSKKVLEIIKQLNKENAPPDGWKPEDKLQASSSKHATQKPQMMFKTILEFEKDEN